MSDPGGTAVQVRAQETASSGAWNGRPRLAKALRISALLVPILLSVLTTAVLGRLIPRPGTTVGLLAWFLGITAVASAVLICTDRIGRRLLPLAALFQLSLAFPDQAPSRFRAALRAGTVRQLEERVARVKAEGLSDNPIVAAETLIELVAALSRHDRITRGHAERVRAYARMIGEELGLDAADADRLQWAALLHDVGKLFVPAEILNKPGALTAEEYEAVQIHPTVGAELCEPLRPWLGDWVDAVGQHHEKWDGTGYPRGLAGRDISLAARIVSVADVYDVITSARSYKAPCTADEARRELARCAGTHFDPRVVRAFLSVSVGRLRSVVGPVSWLAQIPVLAQVSLAPVASVAGSGLVTAGAVMFGGMLDVPHFAPRPTASAEEAPEVGPDGSPREESGGDGADEASGGNGGADRPGREVGDGGDGSSGGDPITGTTTTTTIIGVTTTTLPPDVTTPNLAPLAIDDVVTGSMGSDISVDAPGVLGNDVDVDGDALTAGVRDAPDNGTVVLRSDGGFTYTPAAGFAGTDAFTYTVDDGSGGVDHATVQLVVALPVTPSTWYLGASGPSATTWNLTSSPGPISVLEPDHEGDGDPGLTIRSSNDGLAETKVGKFQEWVVTPSSPVRVAGHAELQLWASREDFKVNGGVDYTLWLRDCAADGTDCVTVVSADGYVEPWNGGLPGWTYQELPLDSIDHTVMAGRQLRLRVMFDSDMWLALSGLRPSRLVVG